MNDSIIGKYNPSITMGWQAISVPHPSRTSTYCSPNHTHSEDPLGSINFDEVEESEI